VGHATWKSLLAHKLRLALTALAVVLGVAFLAGTLVLTDTMRESFDSVFSETSEGIDVAVRGTTELTSQTGQDTRPPVPEALVDRVAAVDGVAAVEPVISGIAQLIGPDGQPIGGGGPPTLAFNAPVDEELSNTELRAGRYPAGPDEVAVDAYTAEANGFAVGDEIQLVANGPVSAHTLVGIVGFGELDNLGGATVVLFDTATAAELFAPDGGYAEVDVRAADGVDPEELRDRIAAQVGGGYEVLTGEELAASAAADVQQALGFLNTGLLVFAGISLFVGAFIISNTFSIIVAQRTRELALLRAVGASRGQVLRSVLAEALATGLFGALAGFALGVGVAAGLRALVAQFGVDLPDTALVVQGRTLVAALVVGVGVTAVAALAPALRSLRVPPVAALQAVVAPPLPRFGRARDAFGVLLVVAGAAALVVGLFADAGIVAVAAGAPVLMIGLAMLSPLVTRPLVRVIGWPVRRAFGIRGELATENALRNPRRTAATASALMIGLGLVVFVMIFGASLTRSAEAMIDEVYLAEYTVTTGGFGTGLPAQAVADLDALEEVAAVTPTYLAEFRDGATAGTGLAVDISTVEQTLALDVIAGDLDDLDRDSVALKESLAAEKGLQVGDTLPLLFADGEREMTVAAIWDSPIDVSWLFSEEAVLAALPSAQPMRVNVKLADGVSPAQADAAIEEVLAGYPAASALDTTEQKEQIEQQVTQLLGLLSALLGLSIVIALFGIVNTLGLSVLERMRELGLLRAVGMTRAQMRAMVRWESVVIAILGAVFGLGIGLLFGWLLTRALDDQGLGSFALPSAQLLGAVVASAVAGIVAAIAPARRAARVDLLRALEME